MSPPGDEGRRFQGKGFITFLETPPMTPLFCELFLLGDPISISDAGGICQSGRQVKSVPALDLDEPNG